MFEYPSTATTFVADDGLTVDDLLTGAGSAVVVKEYPEYPKGAAVLVLQ
jgi:hypothetical protein